MERKEGEEDGEKEKIALHLQGNKRAKVLARHIQRLHIMQNHWDELLSVK